MKKRKIEEVYLKVNSVENFYSGFSDEETKVVNNKIIEYIDDATKYIPNNTQININIKIKNLRSRQKKQECKTAFRNYYKNEITDAAKSVKKLNLVALLLLGVAVAFLVVLHFIVQANAPYILKTALEIVAWVFTWETVDVFFFRTTAERFHLKKVKKIYNSNIKML